MNLFNNPKLSALCRHRFGAVKKRHGRCGFLPGVCARPKRRRVERSAALLLGCDPGNLPMRRRGKRTDGVAGRRFPKRAPRTTAGDSLQRIGDGGRCGQDLDRTNRSDPGIGEIDFAICKRGSLSMARNAKTKIWRPISETREKSLSRRVPNPSLLNS
jgi:hypothetical protein